MNYETHLTFQTNAIMLKIIHGIIEINQLPSNKANVYENYLYITN